MSHSIIRLRCLYLGIKVSTLHDSCVNAASQSQTGPRRGLSPVGALYLFGASVIKAEENLFAIICLLIVVLHMEGGLAMFARLVPIAILVLAIAGVAFGLIADLPVLFRVCA